MAVEPVGGDISVMAEAALVNKAPRTAAEKRMYEHMAKLKPQFDKEVTTGDKEENKLSTCGCCFYTQLPGLIKRVGMSPSELTALNMDKVGDTPILHFNSLREMYDNICYFYSLGELFFILLALALDDHCPASRRFW